jgi:hypothetical protein
VAEDARAAARRIVEEVLAQRGERPSGGSDGGAHDDDGTATPGGATAATGSVAGDETPPPIPLTPPDALDPRSDAAALTGPVVADALDERPSRVTARRIVEEVLAEHAAAQREVEVPAPLAEAEGPPAPAERVPAPAASGRAAVLPTPPVDEGVGVEADPGNVADDAASIARRIVESVLAEAAAREPEPEVVDGAVPPDGSDVATALLPDDGPPPHPVEAAAVEDDEGILHLGTAEGTAAASTDGTSVVSEAGGAADEAERDGTLALPADPTDAPDTAAPLADDERPSDPDETVTLPAAGSDADADETVALPSAGSDADPDETVALPAADAVDTDGPPARPDAGREMGRHEVGGHDAASPGTAEQPQGVGVATLPRTHASAEETTPMPIADSKATRSHWLIASILGAIGLAVLLPLAVAAVRSLVALS